MPILAEKGLCTGCSACSNICTHEAIAIQKNTEGFLCPTIDSATCVECGLCETVCPVLYPIKKEGPAPKTYALWSNPDREYSSSGGAFSAFARLVLKRGGLVFGAVYDKELNLHHAAIETVEELETMRGSKYVQSEIGKVFQDVRKALNKERWVLFCGTPCQIAGLRAFLKKSYDTLLTIDLVCHGVPSGEIFHAYLKKLKNRLGFAETSLHITNYEFRRRDGWGIAPSISTGSNSCHLLYGTNALYMEAFNSSSIFRMCCYSCSYTHIPRIGDITIGDFWGIGRYGTPFKQDTMKGVSLVLINTNHGAEILAALEDVYIEQRTLEEAMIENPNLRAPSPLHPKRDEIIAAFLDSSRTLDSIDKEFKLVDHGLKETVKRLAAKIGFFDTIKRVYNWYRSH